MKKLQVVVVFVFIVAVLRMSPVFGADAHVAAPVTDHDRCAVCGMFVAKYPDWVAQLRMADGHVAMFDGPKDLLAYYFSPQEYGGEDGVETSDILVKDYYTQEWIDGRAAVYVIGSDVYGPMGEELVPMLSREAAQNFMADHHGKQILSFDEVTNELVQSMRKGHKMKGHMKK